MAGTSPTGWMECNADALRTAIASRGMTQASLARAALVGESTVNQLLRTSGRRTTVRISTAALIAAALNAPVGDLFTRCGQTIGA